MKLVIYRGLIREDLAEEIQSPMGTSLNNYYDKAWALTLSSLSIIYTSILDFGGGDCTTSQTCKYMYRAFF